MPVCGRTLFCAGHAENMNEPILNGSRSATLYNAKIGQQINHLCKTSVIDIYFSFNVSEGD